MKSRWVQGRVGAWAADCNSRRCDLRPGLSQPGRRSRVLGVLGFELVLTALVLLLSACASKPPPPPAAAEPSGAPTAPSYQLGAARDTQYKADIQIERAGLRMIVREESVCDVIPISTLIENGEKKRVAGPPTSTKPCDQRFARNVEVALEVAGNTYDLGRPNARGELETAIGNRLLSNLYGDGDAEVPVGKVIVRDQKGESWEVGTIDLTELAKANRRIEQLLAEFRAVLDRPQAQLSGAELAHSYELYEQLNAFGSDDPRVSALSALFLERLYQRKADEASERYRKNLEALAAAKDIFAANRTTIILPGYVSSAIEGGPLDSRTVDWARGQAALALRHDRKLCSSAPGRWDFTWARLNLYPPPPQSKLAFEMLRFAYDNPYEAELTALCRRIYS
jgi:hypothetical protein